MPEIKVLDNNLINKIAAGEVVERPASVVKEIIENAIDAKARMITVEIKDGGTALIRVTDDGYGIPKKQLRQAFMRHATSKIYDLESLENVLTLGFRGEALSSIAGVSQVEMITKTKDAETGSRIEIHGGEIISESETGSADGTTFIIRNLFFNTPARRKFLKKPATEAGCITDVVMRTAFSHPEISFTYINNSSTILQTNGNGDLKTTIFSIYGKEAAAKMLPLSFERDGFSVNGLIGSPDLNRSNRQYENFYINQRYIKSELTQVAIEDGYKTRIPIGRFPVYVLNFTVAPNDVDINVHPTKLEVRFSDEELIFRFLSDAVTNALQRENLIPKQNVVKETETNEIRQAFRNIKFQAEPLSKIVDIKPNEDLILREPLSVAEGKKIYETIDKTKDLPDVTYIQYKPEKPVKNEFITTVQDAKPPVLPFFTHYKIIGQLFRTYWLVEQDESVYLIDQHAAHERVLYEEITGKLINSDVLQQRLVMPVALKLTHSETQTLLDNMEVLERFGFELELFGENTYALRSVPYIFKNPSSIWYFNEILSSLSMTESSYESTYDGKLNRIATIACKAAVKAHDRLSEAEAKALIDSLCKLENPFTCPHGRPTIVELTKMELGKMFKRN